MDINFQELGAFVGILIAYHTTSGWFHEIKHTNLRLSIKEEISEETVSKERYNQGYKEFKEDLQEVKSDIKCLTQKFDKFIQSFINK